MGWVIRFPNHEQDSYLLRYTIKGPKFTFHVSEAYKFPTKDHAVNVLQGDERLKGGKVEQHEG